MIKFQNADMFEIKVGALVHQCNCLQTWGSGVAKRMRLEYPMAYAADLRTINADKEKLGTFSTAICINKIYGNVIQIFNCYGQYSMGRHELQTDYSALEKSLIAVDTYLSKVLRENGITVGLPYRMACDRGGGDWSIVEKIITNNLEKSKHTYLICKYNERERDRSFF